MTIQENVKLAPFTSWLIGGPAEFFVAPTNIEELKESVKWAEAQGHRTSVLGGGSNVLISDSGIKGLVIHLKKLSGIEIIESEKNLRITALAGTTKSELLKTFLKHKLAPALFLAGIPGDVGGGVVMNAGIGEKLVPREFVEIVEWVEVLKPDYSMKVYKHDEIDWSYRHSAGWQPGIITRVGITWPLQPQPDILDKVREANKVRLSKQPLDMPSCGSVFVNPEPQKAAQLIESAGLKGFTVGGAQVSRKHANFIVNTGNASANDIQAVIAHVQETVLEKSSVILKTEVVFLG